MCNFSPAVYSSIPEDIDELVQLDWVVLDWGATKLCRTEAHIPHITAGIKQFGEQMVNITFRNVNGQKRYTIVYTKFELYQYLEALEGIKKQVSFYFLNNHKLFIHNVTMHLYSKCINSFTPDY